MADPEARIPRLTPAEWSEATDRVFAVMADWSDTRRHHIIATFAQHPLLTEPFLRFNRHLLSTNTLPVRLRQLAILRTAWCRGCAYMWSSHVRMSLDLGLDRADFDAVKDGSAAPRWSAVERAVLQAGEQLIARSDIDDPTWQALGTELDRRQRMDLIFTVGAYTLIAMAMNAMRIDREPELITVAEEYGAPDRIG